MLRTGKPQQNAAVEPYVERYNRTLRHAWRDPDMFESIQEGRQIATEWRCSCNNERPNIGNGAMTLARKPRRAA